jgi:Zn-finger nucleic acid-binding protein
MTAMSALALEDRQGTKIEIDLCSVCHAFWFDRYEDIRLSRGASLKLFTIMAEQGSAATQGSTTRPFPRAMPCPRCGSHLTLAHDMQLHATMFQYWRCPRAHGHFITFLEFLKEKDFVRPLTPRQLADLRQNVQTINCSNCGGAIDLAKQSVCPHCGSALSMLDMKQIAAHVGELENAGQAQDGNPPQAALLERQRLVLEHQFAAAIAAASAVGKPQSLVEAGLHQLVRWLTTG